MANDYWNNLVALVRRTEARAEAINSILNAIKAGWDLLPSKARLYEERVSYCVDTGIVNAYILTPTYAVTLTDGARVSFKALVTNTSASVANVYNLGNVAICNYAGAALSGGEIVADAFTELRYNAASAHWRIINPVTAIASVSVTNKQKISATDTTENYALAKHVATAAGGISVTQNSIGGNETLGYAMDINGMAVAAAVDPAADYVPMYDTSVAAVKKTLVSTIADEGQLALVSGVYAL